MRRTLGALALAALAACASTAPTKPIGAAPPAPAAPPAAGPRASDTWWNGAVFYEVFVRSFEDSDGDGVGDLKGLIAKLDYLNDGDPSTTSDLGVDALWLMPVFASPSYHGYDTTDYETVNPAYGTNADLERLVAEAHRRGMKVIVDLVVNHTSDQHPWFREARASPAAPHRGWYVWRADDPGWTQPWNPSQGTWYRAAGGFYYALFWSGMPDLDWRNPAVRAEMGRLATLWLSRGVDGFRLDAVRYLAEDGPGLQADRPDTHRYLKDFAATVRAARPDAALVGEAWADTFTIADYYGDTAAVPGGDELPLLFDFPLASAIVNGVNDGSGEAVATTLAEVLRTYPAGAADAPFLTNHDQARIATQVGNRTEKLKVAAAILLTLPGAPFIYYGEEVGMQNGPGSADEWKRTPMAWDATAGAGFTTGTPWMELAPGHETANVAAETGDPRSLLSRYRDFVRARHASPALRRGDLTLLEPGHKAVLAFTRRAPGELVLVAHNLSGNTVTTAPLAAGGTAAEPLQVDPGATATAGPRGWTVVLPPRSSGMWRLTGGR